MAENILQHADIHIAISIHKRCCGVTELVDRIPGTAQTDFLQLLFYNILYGFGADTLLAAAEE